MNRIFKPNQKTILEVGFLILCVFVIPQFVFCANLDKSFESFRKFFDKNYIPTVKDSFDFFGTDCPVLEQSQEYYAQEGFWFKKGSPFIINEKSRQSNFDDYYDGLKKREATTPSLFLFILRTKIPLSSSFKIRRTEDDFRGSVKIKRCFCEFGDTKVTVSYCPIDPKSQPGDCLVPIFSIETIGGTSVGQLMRDYFGYGKRK